MFGFFKRSKLKVWEKELLHNVIINLPNDYSHLVKQIEDGLFRGVLVDISDIPGYVAFTFNFEVFKKYDNRNERDYKLTEIYIYDNKLSEFIPYVIYICNGVISGYSIGGGKIKSVDVNKIKVSSFKKEYTEIIDNSHVMSLLDDEEKKVLSPSEVYSVCLDNKEYFHIKDLDDGDFVGIDEEKNVYKITHDPMEIKKLDVGILEVLRKEL